ncbi:MAG: hypothetical protein M5U32_16745 [Myxococcota bacterium]|nr:hypothetical protein [Myxococcota bacterium]
MPTPPRRHVGQYVASGDWSEYWTTRISRAESGRIRVRGYPVEELIEHLRYTEAAFLLLRGELPDKRETALFDLALRSGMDQQFINSAACAARFTASAFPDSPVPALASGLLASGSVTGSPQEPAEMLIEAVGWGRAKRTRPVAPSRPGLRDAAPCRVSAIRCTRTPSHAQ